MIELLVVIAIIGILSALLLPALSGAKAQAQSAACKNHLRQMGLALQMYAHENGGKYPPCVDRPRHWWGIIEPYYPVKWTDPAYHCPGYRGAISAATNPGDHDPLGSYAYNWRGVRGYQMHVPGEAKLGLGGFPAVSEAQIKVPSEMFAIAESRFLKETEMQNDADCVDTMFCGFNEFARVLPPRHGKNYNVLLCDGHVAAMNPWILYNPTNTAAMWNNDHQPHPEFWPPDHR